MSAGYLSPGNSTTTPLGFATTFAGTYEPCTNWGSVQVLLLSDVASATKGLKFIWSDDGISDRLTDDVRDFSLSDAEGAALGSAKSFTLNIRANFFRIEFAKSGAANQTIFIVQTTFREVALERYESIGNFFTELDFAQATKAQISQFNHFQLQETGLLIAGATYNSALLAGPHLNEITVSVKSDVDSAVGGLQIRFYGDNTNVDHTLSYTYLAATPLRPLKIPMLERNFSVHYTNGAVGQGVFRLHVFRNVAPGGGFTYPLGHPNDLAWAGSGDGNVIQILKNLAAPTTATLVAASPAEFIKTVAATGTPELISATSKPFQIATVKGVKAARTNNVGNVFFGVTATNDTQAYQLAPGEEKVLKAPPGQTLNFNAIYLDVLNAGDGISCLFS